MNKNLFNLSKTPPIQFIFLDMNIIEQNLDSSNDDDNFNNTIGKEDITKMIYSKLLFFLNIRMFLKLGVIA